MGMPNFSKEQRRVIDNYDITVTKQSKSNDLEPDLFGFFIAGIYYPESFPHNSEEEAYLAGIQKAVSLKNNKK